MSLSYECASEISSVPLQPVIVLSRPIGVGQSACAREKGLTRGRERETRCVREDRRNFSRSSLLCAVEAKNRRIGDERGVIVVVVVVVGGSGGGDGMVVMVVMVPRVRSLTMPSYR